MVVEMFEAILSNMILFWIGVAVFFAIVEGFTTSFFTIWFAAGGAAAAIAAAVGGGIPVQVGVFFVVSVVLLVFTRPILVKRLKLGKEKNYTEQLEGAVALVTKELRPFESGQVKVNGIEWTAVGETEEFAAAEGDKVEVVRVEGVKLIVRKNSRIGE
jgi:membrane protein implicated in regulation of membrane protease activity